jgi:hypothetical protein
MVYFYETVWLDSIKLCVLVNEREASWSNFIQPRPFRSQMLAFFKKLDLLSYKNANKCFSFKSVSFYNQIGWMFVVSYPVSRRKSWAPKATWLFVIWLNRLKLKVPAEFLLDSQACGCGWCWRWYCCCCCLGTAACQFIWEVADDDQALIKLLGVVADVTDVRLKFTFINGSAAAITVPCAVTDAEWTQPRFLAYSKAMLENRSNKSELSIRMSLYFCWIEEEA